MARAERLDRILEGGARVLGERGYHGTTMRDVAKAAGVSFGTLYHYLAGKDDLLYQVQRRILDAAVASARATLAARGAGNRLRALVTDHIRRVLARPAEAAVLSSAFGSSRGDRNRRIQELRNEYLTLVSATVEGAIRRGRGRGREAEAQALMLLGMADRLALDAAGHPSVPRPDRLAARVLHLFLDGARGRG